MPVFVNSIINHRYLDNSKPVLFNTYLFDKIIIEKFLERYERSLYERYFKFYTYEF